MFTTHKTKRSRSKMKSLQVPCLETITSINFYWILLYSMHLQKNTHHTLFCTRMVAHHTLFWASLWKSSTLVNKGLPGVACIDRYIQTYLTGSLLTGKYVSKRSLLQATLRWNALHTRPRLLVRLCPFGGFLETEPVGIFNFNVYYPVGVKPALLGLLKRS